MKNILVQSVLLIAGIAAAIELAPQAALAGGIGNNYVAPAVTFGGGNSSFTIDSKFGVSDNLSLRPFVSFPSEGTRFGTSLTYDWDLRQSPLSLTPFIGAGINIGTGSNNNNSTFGFAQIGADFNVNESIALLGSVAIPFSGGNNSTTVTLGAGLRF